MTAESTAMSERARVQRMRVLARRCRDLSEQTAIPELTRELISIADALDNEADLDTER
ncbi:MAG TPA: hypothetical protein VE397_07540 [Stellaceae bacterium]|jgi:hypothetical protein|nr:hypothetical protein [Stellaceae bacterium]